MMAIWSIKKGSAQNPAEERISEFATKMVRLIRRGWYASLRGILIGLKTVVFLLAKLFFFVFPNAKKAFEEKDELTGLTNGPSSYFLMSVSEYKEEVKKTPARRGRNKKNV